MNNSLFDIEDDKNKKVNFKAEFLTFNILIKKLLDAFCLEIGKLFKIGSYSSIPK